MKKQIIWDQALELAEAREISEAKKLLQKYMLENSKDRDITEFLASLSCISGDFEYAKKLFLEIDSKEDLDYMEETIEKSYEPKFNEMIEAIKGENLQTAKKLLVELEELSRNAEIYEIGLLLFMNDKNPQKIEEYIKKLKSIDVSNSSIVQGEKYLLNHKLEKLQNKNKALKVLMIFSLILLLGMIFFIKENLKL